MKQIPDGDWVPIIPNAWDETRHRVRSDQNGSVRCKPLKGPPKQSTVHLPLSGWDSIIRLTYDGGAGQGLSATTDSDWAADTNDCRSQTGFFLRPAGAPISWTSRTQKTITLSSTEAEYMALSDCSRQVVWVHTLLGELGYALKPIPICSDNQGLIFIASNPVTEKRSKHIDIRYHYIRKVIRQKIVEVYFIEGEENPVDLLTKNIAKHELHLFHA